MVPRKLILRISSSLFLFVSALAGPASAHDGIWLDPALPNRPALGPDKAKGAIIWSHGRSITSEDSQAPTPPYMAALRDGGWDTFRLNRMRDSDSLLASAHALAEEVARLKEKGYRRVALTGQSFGAFLALMAADASDQVDAVIATAPAAYGSFSDYYESWRSNATKLYPLLEQVRRARVMVFYFHGDDFDPGGRGERTQEILAAHHLEHVVIDQPPQLTSHWAATTPLFVRRYARCMLGFLEAARIEGEARCDGEGLRAGGSEPGSLHPAAAQAASTQGPAQRMLEQR